MADSKISNLPAATTPLDGTEVLPIVDGGVTQKVSVANLTAGRAISATQVTVTTGNIVIGTAGKGIDFSADNPDLIGMTSELLDDYEEGTYTVTIGCGTSGTVTLNAALDMAQYTKVGRLVTIRVYLGDAVGLQADSANELKAGTEIYFVISYIAA